MRNAGWLAVVGAVAVLAGCGTVSAGRPAVPVFVIGGKTMPQLDGAKTLFQRVMTAAGFHLADFPAPGPTAPGPVATAP